MKYPVIPILCIITCTSAFGQFFSEEEREARHEDEEKVTLRQSVPEAEQKQIYMDYCAALKKAKEKAARMYPVKIHFTPEKREERRQRAENTRKSLMKVYRKELAEKHTISETYLEELVQTGRKKAWPEQKPAPPAKK